MQTQSARMPCTHCGAEILLLTAERYDGLCKPCFDNFRIPCTSCGAKIPPRTAESHAGLCESCFGKLSGLESAVEQTSFHQTRLGQIKTILHSALGAKEEMDLFEQLNVRSLVTIPSSPELLDTPARPEPAPPTYLGFPPEPRPESFPGASFEKAYARWADDVKRIEAENQQRYERNVAAIRHWNKHRAKREQDMAAWHERFQKVEAENLKRTNEYAAALERWKAKQIKYQESDALVKAGYESREPEAVKLYCKIVLQFSNLPDGFRRDFDLEYIPETQILIVDYALPAPNNLSRVKEVKFVESRHEFVEVFLSEREFDEIYDDALYQTCLRTIHELFHADIVGALAAIVFNGWIESVDKATGNDTKGCVLSVQAKKEEFQKINLARVDPKACFKALKGIGSSTLHSLTPIAPVLKINRDDRRFVASHGVTGELDERFNLAAMDWEDFEHLIRELFEKEFSRSGSEVKVTQASRDGGVDAVVFDPDPIHGGKTIIQAKRYTNTVGVAAVRELYGTVLNEGAMKGILVTTADFGPDAYEFAAGKPLVLLNGANLLHLLEKHGHKAKIDIKEAKRILGEKVQ